MKNAVPIRPAPLATYLANLLAGDDKHTQDGALPKELRADLSARKTQLDSLNTSVQLSKGQYRKSTQGRLEFIQATLPVAEKARDLVFGKYGHKDEVLVDFGLSTRRKAHRGPNAAGATHSASAVAARNVVKAKAKVSRAETRLKEAQERYVQAQAHLNRWEAESALAEQAAPPGEPTSSAPTPSEPTPPSGGK